jgi:hypothetical protein
MMGCLVLACEPVHADELTIAAPVPAAEAFPALAGRCFRTEAGIAVLGQLKREHPGSAAFAFIGDPQQAFADAWRDLLGRASVKVSVMLAWLVEGGVAAVSEYGPDGCLITATVISGAQWNAIVAMLRKTRGT